MTRAAPSSPFGRGFAVAQRRWRPIEPLGRGAYAEVWRACDAEGREVALKVATCEAADERIAQEHALLAALAHPNVVATFGLVRYGARAAIALELLGAGDLVPLTGAHPRHWVRAALEVLDALEHLEARGFVHRDVKARNVLFGADGRARLVDFGSALARGSLGPSGGTTAAHRAPGRNAGGASAAEDAYAFAVLLYELLAGRLPYGPEGPSGRPEPPPWPLSGATDSRAEALVAVVQRVLSGGSARLSAFRDVLESAAAAYRGGEQREAIDHRPGA